jgi:nucleoside-diphosphate-sugar epimerase/GT2 family glycosyltransferase
MGGMGTIHEENDFILYRENHLITLNLLHAALDAGVRRFLYASSACVYPESLQNDTESDVSLRESDVWEGIPRPQGLYGTEKLISEILLAQFEQKMDIRIARFHNVFGPGGVWNNGREKAPAAMLRKAIVIDLLNHMGYSDVSFEIWGDGKQRRSFLYIHDAVEGVLKLLDSGDTKVCNIGSDKAVTIQGLVELALKSAGVDRAYVQFSYDTAKPVGVSSRNSNNEHVQQALKWQPSISLEEGMKMTAAWIREEIIKIGPFTHEDKLRDMLQSKVLHLNLKPVVFAILLPITSRGSSNPNDCLDNLRKCAKSLFQTTSFDCSDKAKTRFRITIYLAIDNNDNFLLRPSAADDSINRAEQVLREEHISNVVNIICSHPPGHVCKIWRDCAKRAFDDGCDFMVLLGDDVELKDEGWMREICVEFEKLASSSGATFGFGCIAFRDISFPGMPTFPILHRTHMEIFNGEVIPDVFVNQDGDPFLFQLYRRFGCSRMFACRISNGVGGAAAARYTKQPAKDWTFETLDNAVATTENWLQDKGCKVTKVLALDVVIPSYRVDMSILSRIFGLKSSETCSLMFIVIIDNPFSPHISELNARFAHRPDVRIRVNEANRGASAARNRGLGESAGEWVHFLDDDVIPEQDIFIEVEQIIRSHPTAAGFIGNSIFPPANSIFTAAIHMSGVTYFWDIATKISDDVPWGVTANLIVRRNVRDKVAFNLIYPKTGGGEDIQFCLEKRAFSIAHRGEAFFAAPDVKVVHPWWDGGKRSYWRFHYWSIGDGALVKEFPEHTYMDFAPNSAEWLLLCFLAGAACTLGLQWNLVIIVLKATLSIILVNVLYDCYRHLYRNPDRLKNIDTNLGGGPWLVAVVESAFIRIFSESGRVRGMIQRGEYGCIGRRFDWFTGRLGTDPIREERMNNLEKTTLSIFVATVLLLY